MGIAPRWLKPTSRSIPRSSWKGTSISSREVWRRAALFELQPPPTAIFAFSDMIAIGAMRAARARGIAIPEELSIVGFDDSAYSRVVHPALTTVRQPLAETGAMAVDLLVRLMRKEPVDTLHLEKFTRLVVRDTTSTPRVESRPS